MKVYLLHKKGVVQFVEDMQGTGKLDLQWTTIIQPVVYVDSYVTNATNFSLDDIRAVVYNPSTIIFSENIPVG